MLFHINTFHFMLKYKGVNKRPKKYPLPGFLKSLNLRYKLKTILRKQKLKTVQGLLGEVIIIYFEKSVMDMLIKHCQIYCKN